MNFHIFTIIIIYLLLICIIHIILKNNLEQVSKKGSISKKNINTENINNENINTENINNENINTENINELENINDFDENSIRNELLSYLNIEKQQRDEELNNFLEKTDEKPVKGSNYFSKKSVFNFGQEEIGIDKNFNTINNDINTFDPVPTDKDDDIEDNIMNSGILNESDNKVFDGIEAFDDFDQSYASII